MSRDKRKELQYVLNEAEKAMIIRRFFPEIESEICLLAKLDNLDRAIKAYKSSVTYPVAQFVCVRQL